MGRIATFAPALYSTLEQSHYIVVYKLTSTKVWVSDPAKGLLTYKAEHFKKGWLDNKAKWVVMAMEPMVDFAAYYFKSKHFNNIRLLD